jgi:hypothetical protein
MSKILTVTERWWPLLSTKKRTNDRDKADRGRQTDRHKQQRHCLTFGFTSVCVCVSMSICIPPSLPPDLALSPLLSLWPSPVPLFFPPLWFRSQLKWHVNCPKGPIPLSGVAAVSCFGVPEMKKKVHDLNSLSGLVPRSWTLFFFLFSDWSTCLGTAFTFFHAPLSTFILTPHALLTPPPRWVPLFFRAYFLPRWGETPCCPSIFNSSSDRQTRSANQPAPLSSFFFWLLVHC